MITESHPDRWAFGGILVRVDWVADGTSAVGCWDGVVRRIQRGDTMVALRTAQGPTPIHIQPRSEA